MILIPSIRVAANVDVGRAGMLGTFFSRHVGYQIRQEESRKFLFLNENVHTYGALGSHRKFVCNTAQDGSHSHLIGCDSDGGGRGGWGLLCPLCRRRVQIQHLMVKKQKMKVSSFFFLKINAI